MTLCDASSLVALINRKDKNHQRCLAILPQLRDPLVTTWACFTEAMYLLRSYGGWRAQDALWDYVASRVLIFYSLSENDYGYMRRLMEQYRDLPMDLADASLVAAAESLGEQLVFTLDRDFLVYRLTQNRAFTVLP